MSEENEFPRPQAVTAGGHPPGPTSQPNGLQLLAGAHEHEAIAALLARCPVRALRAGERLLAPGESNAALYLILEGRLREQAGGSETEAAAVRAAGESVGELSALAGRPAEAAIVAETDARVQIVEAPVLWALVETSHAVARNLLAVLARRQREEKPPAVRRREPLERAYERHRLVDELTGLHNRRWFDNMLRRLIVRSSMNRDALSLVLVQINDLADYRKQFGETAADAALYTVARTLHESLRPTDLLARYGEQEFAVALPYTDRARALIVAERLGEAVAEAVVVMDDESLLPSVSVSFGVAEMIPHEHAEDLIGRVAGDLVSHQGRRRDRLAAGGAIPPGNDPSFWRY